MKIVKPSYEILTPLDKLRPVALALIEMAGRVCYKSEDQITPETAGPFVEKIARVHKHESVLEHVSVSVRFICDRGVSHELVRHRLASFSQESTRYCNYSKGKFGREITVIRPPIRDIDLCTLHDWTAAMKNAEQSYLNMIGCGVSPQIARSVLPNSLKTEIVMTANLREWKHFFKLRAAKNAHPQMRQLMIPLAKEFFMAIPEIFDNPEIF